MKIDRKILQLSLLSFGFILILGTYFLYPKIKKNSDVEVITNREEIVKKNKESNLFENVEYKGLYNFDQPFVVESKKAHILNEEPDIVYMNEMTVTLHMQNGKVVIITSDKGNYNKINYDCFFEGNVKAIDDETIITADKLDLLATEDYAVAYNNVVLVNNQGSLNADKVKYDFKKEHYHVSMFNNEKVKINLFK